MEKASGVNLEAKSGAGVPEAVCVILATPATSLEPVVLALAFPLDYFSDVKRGICCLGNSHIILPRLRAWERTLQLRVQRQSPPYRTCYHGRLKDAYDDIIVG